MTINGFAILVFFGATLIVGVVCYAWGYWDGMETERKTGATDFAGRAPRAHDKNERNERQ